MSLIWWSSGSSSLEISIVTARVTLIFEDQ